MPELPEVETVRRGMEGAVSGKIIVAIQVNRYDLRGGVPKDLALRMSGRVITNLERRGKYILIHMGDKECAVLHLGMSGRIRIFPSPDSYQPHKHDHITMTMDDGAYIVFEDPRRFGMFYLIEQDKWSEETPFSSMGAEPLGNAWSAQDLLQKLRHKKSPIKTALLDQAVVAGLGNIYVCEALYHARISPLRLAHTISEDEAEKLVICVRKVLNDALDSGGSTLKDYAHTDGSLGYFQHRFGVYDREGVECANHCGDVIKRKVQSGRSTFYCPICQL